MNGPVACGVEHGRLKVKQDRFQTCFKDCAIGRRREGQNKKLKCKILDKNKHKQYFSVYVPALNSER